MKTPFERKLIFEDENQAREIVSDLEQFKPLLHRLKAAFEKLDIGKFTNTEFKILIVAGIARYEKKFIESINQQLEKAGIKSQLLRENAIKDHQKYLDELAEVREELKRFVPTFYSMYGRPALTLKYISFNKVFYIDDSDFEEIKEEYCRIYLETAEQAEGWEALKELSEKYNDFVRKLQPFNYPTSSATNFHFLYDVLDVKSNRIEPKPGGFIAAATKHQREVDYQNKKNKFQEELRNIEVKQ